MSHQPERKEKNCLNCGAIVAGRYCQVCGQENIVPKQSFGGLLKHFIYDVFHFDGKFFDTLRYLLFRPGYIPKQYIMGKRHSWLDPIRMYLFTSAVFFLIFFSVKNPEENITVGKNEDLVMTKQERFAYAGQINQRLNATHDTGLQRQLTFLLDTAVRIVLTDSAQSSGDSVFPGIWNKKWMVAAGHTDGTKVNKGSSWLDRQVEGRWKAYKRQYGDDKRAMITAIIKSFFHRIPYMLFVSLPFFALILKLLYVRRKNFYYSDHAVFTLYQYIFGFIVLLIAILFGELHDVVGWGIFDLIRGILILSGGVYLLIAMKRFYMQGMGKTILKFVLLNVMAMVIMLMLFVVFLFFSIFQI